MSEYTPTEARICIDFCNAATKRAQPDGSFMSMEEADAAFSRWLAAHDAEVLRAAATELEQSIHHLDPANPSELSFINCTRIDAKLLRDRADRAGVRVGLVAEEPEWEYGVEMPLHTGTVVVASRDEATARAEAWLYPLHRRRKAGPWVPVNAGDGS